MISILQVSSNYFEYGFHALDLCHGSITMMNPGPFSSYVVLKFYYQDLQNDFEDNILYCIYILENEKKDYGKRKMFLN